MLRKLLLGTFDRLVFTGRGSLVGLMTGVLTGILSPYWRSIPYWIGDASLCNYFNLYLASLFVFAFALPLLGIGLIIGLFSGTLTTVVMQSLGWCRARSLLLPLLAILCGIPVAMILADLPHQPVVTGTVIERMADFPPGFGLRLFGPAEGFLVAVVASLYVGLLTERRLAMRPQPETGADS